VYTLSFKSIYKRSNFIPVYPQPVLPLKASDAPSKRHVCRRLWGSLKCEIVMPPLATVKAKLLRLYSSTNVVFFAGTENEEPQRDVIIMFSYWESLREIYLGSIWE